MNTNSQHKVAMIMAGGTGGHVFPALAVARVLREKGVVVHWLGTRTGLESRIVPAAGFDIEYINVQGLRGNGVLRLLLAPFKLLFATMQAFKICLKLKPGFVLGMGGFVTGPGGLAARLSGRPLIVHEQNAIPGLTNNLLSRIATRVLEAFPNAFDASRKAVVTGNPVRESILKLAEPISRYSERQDGIRILIVGGSLGAQVLNEIVPQALALLDHEVQVWHQAGRGKLEQTIELYKDAKYGHKVVEFIDDMDSAYEWADLIICRAGAMTIAEISAAGLASILVPYPLAVDDHQSANARLLQDAQAALVIQQRDLTVNRLTEELNELFVAGRKKLLDMANRAYAIAKANATDLVVQHCLEVAK